MKEEIHPDYQDVLFIDTLKGHKFVCGSTLQTKDRDTFEGKEYPCYRAEITSASHPLFTGSGEPVDIEKRVGQFHRRYGKREKKASESKE